MPRAKTAKKEPGVKHVSFIVDEELHSRYKIACAANRKEMKADLVQHMETQATLYEQRLLKK